MADVKISDLPAAGTITGAELMPVVQGGVTSKATASSFATGAIQFSEGTASTTPANPTNTNGLAIYLGRSVIGELTALYFWSPSLSQWIPVIAP